MTNTTVPTLYSTSSLTIATDTAANATTTTHDAATATRNDDVSWPNDPHGNSTRNDDARYDASNAVTADEIIKYAASTKEISDRRGCTQK